MNSRDKTREELLKELRDLQEDYNSMTESYEKDISRHKLAEEKLRESEVCKGSTFSFKIPGASKK